jgi:4-amino-4-deoxy-L-arabinose transferase-like glycosyltransferase
MRSRLLIVLLLLAALLRILYLADTRAHSVYWDALLLDAALYDDQARLILSGDWLGGAGVYTLPPLYPYVVAALYSLSGSHLLAVRLFQLALGLVNVALVWSIGRAAFGRRVGLIAAGLAVSYGPFLFMEAKLMGTTLGVTLGLCLLRLLMRGRAREAPGQGESRMIWGGAGLLLGLTALARPETLLFAPLAAVWVARVARRPIRSAGLLLAGVALALSPVAIRNAGVSGEWSPANLISSQSGITFYQANNPRAGGVYVFLGPEGFSGDPRRQADEEQRLAERATGLSMTRSQVTRYWMGRGLDWIVSDPGAFLILEARKLARYLGSYEYSTEYVYRVEREWVRTLWIPFLPFAAISCLALAGLVALIREGPRPDGSILGLFILANLAASLMFYVSSRYRLPAVPAMIVLAALGADRFGQALARVRPAQRGWLVAGAAALVLLFVGLHVPLDERHLSQESYAHQNAGTLTYERGEFADAERHYRRAVEIRPGNWRSFYGLGQALEAQGLEEEAMDAYRAALRLRRRFPEARRRLEILGARP